MMKRSLGSTLKTGWASTRQLKFWVVQVVLLWLRYRSITGLWKEAGFAQRVGDSKVNMKVKLHQENKAIVAN
jgi:hypothetical protein